MRRSPSRWFAAALIFAAAAGLVVAAEEDAIKVVTAAGGKVSLERVAKSKNKVVSGVTLGGAKVSDATLKSLLEFPALIRVEIKNATKVTPDGSAELGKVKKLQAADLSGPFVSDATAKALAGVGTLTELTLSGGALTDDGVKELAALSKLEALALTGNKKLKGETVPKLGAIKTLSYLAVGGCELGDLAGWAALAKSPKLTSLALPQGGVTDAGLKELAKLTQLTSLSLEGCPVTDAGLAELKTLKALDRLNVAATKITENAVPTLSAMKKLTALTVSEKQIGKAGGETLKKALPNCDVNVMP